MKYKVNATFEIEFQEEELDNWYECGEGCSPETAVKDLLFDLTDSHKITVNSIEEIA